MNASLEMAIVNRSALLIFVKDMAHPGMKKAWLGNVYKYTVYHTERKSLPLSFHNFSFLYFLQILFEHITAFQKCLSTSYQNVFKQWFPLHKKLFHLVKNLNN